jgi:hypothetical protein
MFERGLSQGATLSNFQNPKVPPPEGHVSCRACAASDHAAAPPSNVMKSRRFLSNMELSAPWVTARVGTALTAGPRGRPKPFIVPERPSLHEVTISHPPEVTSRSGGPRRV